MTLRGFRRDVRKLREVGEVIAGFAGPQRRDVIDLVEISPGVFARPNPTRLQRAITAEKEHLDEAVKDLKALGELWRRF